MELGKNIKEHRKKQKGLTQAKLAEKVGASFQAVSCWEMGRYAPDIDKLPELAAALDTTVDRLLRPSEAEKLTPNEHFSDEQRTYTFLKTTCRGQVLLQAALPFAREAYGTAVLPGTQVPYFNLPLRLACHCLSMRLTEEDAVAALLCRIGTVTGREAFPPECPESVKHSVRLFAAYETGVYDKEALEKDRRACLLVLLNAVHAPTAGRHTAAETAGLAVRAQKEALPLTEVLKKGTEAENNAAWLLSHALMEQTELIRRFV